MNVVIESDERLATTPVMDAAMKYRFDLQGYLVLPGILEPEQISLMRDHLETLRNDPESLPPAMRSPLSGPCEQLISHPVVMDILYHIIGKLEKIRLENAFYDFRELGHQRWDPHAGGRTVNPNYNYIYHDGKMYSGMTRVVWELNEVREWQGGTAVIPGSHKANFKPTPEIDAQDSGVWSTYACPPGSLVIFSEAVRHAGCSWTNPDNPRQAVFCAYNHICVHHHKPGMGQLTPEVIAAFSEQHQRFFNDVHHPQFDRAPWA